jgi:hypothetical protein
MISASRVRPSRCLPLSTIAARSDRSSLTKENVGRVSGSRVARLLQLGIVVGVETIDADDLATV